METKRIIPAFILVLFAFAACQNSSRQNIPHTSAGDSSKNEVRATSNIRMVDKVLINKNSLPNDRFRKEIVSKITNQRDLKKFDTLLISLDEKGVSFCEFVHRLFQLDDSCYALAKQKYSNPLQQTEFVKTHDNSIKQAEAKYLKSLNLRKDFSMFASAAYNFDEGIKAFCGNY